MSLDILLNKKRKHVIKKIEREKVYVLFHLFLVLFCRYNNRGLLLGR